MRKTKTPLITTGVFALFVIFGGAMLYMGQVFVENDIDQIKDGIEAFTARGSAARDQNELLILSTVDIDEMKLVLFSLGSQLGDAKLRKGLFNKYVIESSGYGTNLFPSGVIQTERGHYLWLMGKNDAAKPGKIVLSLDGKDYTFDIPANNDYFIKYTGVPPTSSNFPREMKRYDVNGELLD
ncbi:MAG: hypothetical protein PHU78_06995 [Heliobacteriaceae bacterium]|nr:hypothetical protein [Heliobacteriaceae bacterium]